MVIYGFVALGRLSLIGKEEVHFGLTHRLFKCLIVLFTNHCKCGVCTVIGTIKIITNLTLKVTLNSGLALEELNVLLI